MESSYEPIEPLGASARPNWTSGRQTIDNIQGRIVGTLRETAQKLSAPGSGGVSSRPEWVRVVAHTSEWINSAADCVERIDPGNLKEDFREKVSQNPGKSLVIAGIAGLALGTLLRRR